MSVVVRRIHVVESSSRPLRARAAPKKKASKKASKRASKKASTKVRLVCPKKYKGLTVKRTKNGGCFVKPKQGPPRFVKKVRARAGRRR